MTGLSGLGFEGSVSILEHFLLVDLGVLGVEGPLWTKFSDSSRTSSCILYCPGSSIFGISGDTMYLYAGHYNLGLSEQYGTAGMELCLNT